ncbi:uncharacterized protein RCC_09420 [Ramularia collo-cygni]|uniref:gamma-glutamylcyclotransferase n=1 Tax=Ramularia collo-cygni TaxID=112498 RepID=A0A2D3V2V7_9PEZI|nr:uncharacterized protein RCC_09420 [Ramularia collo-cygni]CZT23706.1 uncharacterized protein RCC_09420 [Ramularia collo-cygni]
MRPQSDNKIWYFAYGSNMSASKFTGSRGIAPLKTARAKIPNWTLTLEIPGTPYKEPAYTTIRPISGVEINPVEVVGLAYLITAEQYIHLVASEGGGIAYKDIALRAVPAVEEDREVTGEEFVVRTLGTVMQRSPAAAASQRYMVRCITFRRLQDFGVVLLMSLQDLVLNGAVDAKLPEEYCRFLHRLPIYRTSRGMMRRLGALLFLAFWTPVMLLVEKMALGSLGPDGNVPAGVGQVVRLVVYVMWAYHDCVHAPFWGRGDGMDGVGGGGDDISEKAGLLV